MRALLLILTLVLVVVAGGCNKTNSKAQTDDSSGNSSLWGSWRLIVTGGGLAGRTTYPAPNAPDVLSLQSDQTYQKRLSGFIYSSGTFRLDSSSVFTGVRSPVIIFDRSETELIRVINDTLTLGEDLDDNFESTYVRFN